MNDSKKYIAGRWKNFKKNPDKNETKKALWSSEEFTLMFHTNHFSQSDLIIKQDAFPGIAEKEIIEITPLDNTNQPFLVQVSSESFTNKANITLSINSQLASVLRLGSLRSLSVKVDRVCSNKYDCEEMVVSIKDQHMYRSDMWKCSQGYQGMAVYQGQIITKYGFRAVVSTLASDNKEMVTAIVTSSTKITFRTKSCRMIWMIEMSMEMWEYSPSGILYWEKMITFLITAFERQLLKKVTHDLSIVFFTKLLSDDGKNNVYKEIIRINDLRNSWMDVLKVVKKEIMFFPAIVNWENNQTPASKAFKAMYPISRYNDEDIKLNNLHSSLIYYTSNQAVNSLSNSVLPSNETSLLESINYSITQMDQEDVKNCTGRSLMIISAGSGLYFTSKPLTKITKLRVLSQGISINIISMKRPPLHSYPLFIYDKNVFEQEFFKKTQEIKENTSVQPKQRAKPTWLQVLFFYSFMQLEGTYNLQSAIHTQIHERPKMFHPLFRIPGKTELKLLNIKSCIDIRYDSSSISMAIYAMKFQFNFHGPNIFKNKNDTKKDTVEIKQNHLNYRKASAERTLVQNKLRKDSFDTLRMDSLLEIDSFRNTLITTQSSVHFNKKIYSSLKRRWAECYKVLKDCNEEIIKDENRVNDKAVLEYYESAWSLLLEPCLLPLVNDFWPVQKHLGVTHPYNSYFSYLSRDQAIQNIIGSKLDKGFQIVKKNAINNFGRKIVAPDFALSLGAAYHNINPDSSDSKNVVYVTNCPMELCRQASEAITIYNPIAKTFETNEYWFTFIYPDPWDKNDSKMLGH
jgi:Vacuolar membrane-associated protein Iml1